MQDKKGDVSVSSELGSKESAYSLLRYQLTRVFFIASTSCFFTLAAALGIVAGSSEELAASVPIINYTIGLNHKNEMQTFTGVKRGEARSRSKASVVSKAVSKTLPQEDCITASIKIGDREIKKDCDN